MIQKGNVEGKAIILPGKTWCGAYVEESAKKLKKKTMFVVSGENSLFSTQDSKICLHACTSVKSLTPGSRPSSPLRSGHVYNFSSKRRFLIGH